MATPKKSKLTLGEYYRMGVGTGRPPKYNTPEKFQAKIQEYFNYCTEVEETPTITGLCLYCGFCDRQSFQDYEKDKPEFSFVTRSARMIIAKYHEIQIDIKDKPNGNIFMLRVLGFQDTKKVELETSKKPKSQGFKIGGREIKIT